ncbi:MAG: phosphocholine cytidylyltransferase family protein [Candidatus Hydrogenedentes bacterium]|nr:phosphocholine cytidylyltransferase family protein [Candidatus Hydrogenedentota bacterium]
MQVIIIGAGRGARLMPATEDAPKCFAEVADRRILDWTSAALGENGLDKICFIGGYRIEKVRAHYPHFEFRHNDRWPDNNILASLFYAEDRMDGPFICCYSDILFNANVVRSLMASDADIALGVDTAWMDRYEHRSEHPTGDAEKVCVENGCVTQIHRDLHDGHAHGEFIGVAKFSAAGAARLKAAYHDCRKRHSGKPFREAPVFEKAYFIHLLQEMLENGVSMAHVDTPGGYIEIDTQQDLDYARENWVSNHLQN